MACLASCGSFGNKLNPHGQTDLVNEFVRSYTQENSRQSSEECNNLCKGKPNVCQFSLGLPRNFSSFFIHDLFVFDSFALLSWKFGQFASLPWNTHFRTKQIHSFEFEFFVILFCAESFCISSEISLGKTALTSL